MLSYIDYAQNTASKEKLLLIGLTKPFEMYLLNLATLTSVYVVVPNRIYYVFVGFHTNIQS